MKRDNTNACEESRLASNGLSLAARLWGPPAGRPVIALHGWLDNAASFDALGPLLTGLRLCALDLAGHGRSDHRPPGCAYHFVDNVADVLGAADALGWRRFALLGHSMGAGVATLAAAAAPERITGAVLIEGLGPVTTAADEAPAVLRRALTDAARGASSRMIYESFEAAVRARMDGAEKLSRSAARLLCERGVERVEGGYAWGYDRRLRSTSRLRLTEELVLAFIAAMRVPTCVIRAEQGHPWLEREAFARRVATHPQLQVQTLPGGHHLHMEEAAARVAELVVRFLGEHLETPVGEHPREGA